MSKIRRAPSQRQLRVGEEIRHVLAETLTRGALRDPALHDVSVTVTEVRPSPDLRQATVFIMPLGGAGAAPVVEALNRAAAFLQSQMGRSLALKFTPRLRFVLDSSFERADAVDHLLRSDTVARDLASDDTQGTGNGR